MAKTILEALIEEQPNGLTARSESLNIVHALVKLHMDEIEEAREHGYSWTQIETACKELWKLDSKGSKIIWPKDNDLIRRCYQAIKEGRKLRKLGLKSREVHKEKNAKKYSIEVTEA